MTARGYAHSYYDEILAVTGEETVETIKPFWAREEKDKEGTLEWLNEAHGQVYNLQRARANRLITNLALYKGIYWESQDPYADFRNLRTYRVQETRKVTVNDVYHYCSSITGKLNRIRPNVVVAPYTNEYNDKVAARVGKKVLDSIEEQFKMEHIYANCNRQNFCSFSGPA